MTDTTVAELDRGSTELHDALSRANGFWDDSRRQATSRRYLLPHGEAHQSLHSQLAAVLAAATQARVAAHDANLALTAARREYEQAQHQIAAAGAQLAESQMAAEAALGAEGVAADVYDNAVRLVEEANTLSP